MVDNVEENGLEDDKNEIKDLKSVFTTNFPGILSECNISLAVSTYQAGKLVLLRNDNGTINTHFRNFNRPMGVAVKPNRISIGCHDTVCFYQNIPAIIDKLEEPEKYDVCYVPRRVQMTGAIDIHEMAWGKNPNDEIDISSQNPKQKYLRYDELWIVNTSFSSLCTIDPEFSFCPQWKPKFITSLAPEDRCHLNGLGMVDGKPKYVTALGETDIVNGWRENKHDGGILIDVEKNEVVLRGLSMPHSPRWYQNKIWMLESGHGTLTVIDPVTYEKKTIAKLPGFTRGLDFYGPLAFIGLSKVRETAVFSDFPLLEELEERICGVYVVDIRNGNVVSFIRFEGDVEEIFAVQLLHNTKFPEIMEVDDELLHSCYIIPDKNLKDVKKTI